MVNEESIQYFGKNQKLYIDREIGNGAQGTVFLAHFNQHQFALKLYKKTPSLTFVSNLINTTATVSPSDVFIWPKQVVNLSDGNVGYLMPLIPANYTPIIAILNGKRHFSNFQTMLMWCINVIHAMKKLHQKGLCFRDLNEGGFFADIFTGDARICDCDNIAPHNVKLEILGKMKYMAPEVILKKKMPNLYSDYYSLAILLFQVLTNGHPMMGARIANYEIIDERGEYVLFAVEPVFVYHKTNTINRPIPGYHDVVIERWRLLPKHVQEAFHQVFVDGIYDDKKRLSDQDWLSVFIQFYNDLLQCDECGFEFTRANIPHCPKCGACIPKRLILSIKSSRVVLEKGKMVIVDCDVDRPLGFVIANKIDPSILGMRNTSNEIWKSQVENVKAKDYSHGQVLPFQKYMKIQFGNQEYGKIE